MNNALALVRFSRRDETRCTARRTFDRRQAQLLCDLGVLDRPRLVEMHPLDPLGHVRRRSDRGSTAKGLELDVGDDTCERISLDLREIGGK